MSLFFETLYIDDGQIRNLSYHNKRMNQTIDANFGTHSHLDLSHFVDLEQSYQRCKVIYDQTIQTIQYHPITKRKFGCFKIINADIDYSYKYLDRSAIDALSEHRGECDDIIIVHNGKVLDTSIANIAYFDGERWITPAEPLLRGTMRASLLDRGRITEGDVHIDDLRHAHGLAIMNAIVGFVQVEMKFG